MKKGEVWHALCQNPAGFERCRAPVCCEGTADVQQVVVSLYIQVLLHRSCKTPQTVQNAICQPDTIVLAKVVQCGRARPTSKTQDGNDSRSSPGEDVAEVANDSSATFFKAVLGRYSCEL